MAVYALWEFLSRVAVLPERLPVLWPVWVRECWLALRLVWVWEYSLVLRSASAFLRAWARGDAARRR